MSRRSLLRMSASGLTAMAATGPFAQACRADRPAKTEFQVACMTLPYMRLPLERALTGIKSAGYRYVAWGTTHPADPGGDPVPVMPIDAPPALAKQLADRCRDMGLDPLMMFSTVYPESENGLKVLTHRLRQAGAARIPQLLTFGYTKGGNRKIWIERFIKLGPIARDEGVLLVVKQHGGSTGTGQACAEIIREVGDPGIRVNYDAGNVMDYLEVDPIPDIQKCAAEVHSFCLKDHRSWPNDEDCGPGFGEIDHYRLLHPVAFTGRMMPLCCENISAPLMPQPTSPQLIDRLARQVREYVETVIAGLAESKP